MQILVTVAPHGQSTPGSPRAYTVGQRDAHAIEAGVELCEASADGELVAATVGPAASEPVLRTALARGADRAVRLWDDRLAESDLFDPQPRARLLAAFAADIDPTLVVTGADGFGATGVALAARLEYGWASAVTDLTLDREAGVVSVRRELEGRLTELLEVALPAVLTVENGCTEPRHAGLGAVREAQRADIVVRAPADPAEGQSRLTRVGTTGTDRDVTLFEGPPEDAAADLATLLRSHGVEP